MSLQIRLAELLVQHNPPNALLQLPTCFCNNTMLCDCYEICRLKSGEVACNHNMHPPSPFQEPPALPSLMSNAPVASSRSKILVLFSIALAMATHYFWTPDNWISCLPTCVSKPCNSNHHVSQRLIYNVYHVLWYQPFTVCRIQASYQAFFHDLQMPTRVSISINSKQEILICMWQQHSHIPAPDRNIIRCMLHNQETSCYEW